MIDIFLPPTKGINLIKRIKRLGLENNYVCKF